ncbi:MULTISPECIES: polysaccharide deacetylase family protein [unclassified Lysinibacillus]|uniref:polysaccharide deacetylase family protein n=1 Tax=unclassified Lysinibacillus TaxID=2636778 RepID=UPI0025539CD6|nr:MULTISPECIES: polysaccharide deacetylase family protein [unclassified Lysinibacillus]MDM5248672.1 polysaccharide deacetylase family protein [Lysinibacillus sp. G4S2]
MKKLLPYAIFLTFLISFVFVDFASANAEGTTVIQSVVKDTTVYVEPSVESAGIGQVAKGSYVTATPVNQEWTKIKVQQLEGYVETAALKSLTSEKYVVTKKGGTTLFTYPSPSAQKTGQLNENTLIFVYGSAPGGWSFVQYGQETGYVATNSLKKAVATKKRVNAVNGAVLRVTASPSGEVVGTLANKTSVQHFTTIAGWAYVEAGDQKGYVKASELANIQILDNKVYNKGVPAAKGQKKRVALTFDDGPDAKVTPQVLAILKKYDAKATFFMVGTNVSRNPALVEQIYEAGHEIGNHTWNHSKLTNLSTANVKQEVNKTSDAIYKAIGQYPTVFRPPYGATSDKVRSVITMPSILWSIDTLDWKHRNADKILSYVKSSVKDGSIILMHDIHQSTANGLENVILYLQKQGYEFVTVSEILQ